MILNEGQWGSNLNSSILPALFGGSNFWSLLHIPIILEKNSGVPYIEIISTNIKELGCEGVKKK